MSDDVNERLAAALREVGLDEMADDALKGQYHDFQSPLAMPSMALAEELHQAAIDARKAGDRERATKIEALRHRHTNLGEFDA